MERTYLRGDIYYADLQKGVGSEQEGYRPVVIIQNNVGNKYSPTVIVAAITSKADMKPHLPTHYYLNGEDGLEIPSIILLEQLRTIDKSRLDGYIGHLSKEHIAGMAHALAVSIDLIETPRSKEKSPTKQFSMTLCGRCLGSFQRTNAYHIRRADPSQLVKETCMFCGIRMGYDYLLAPKERGQI